MGILTDDMKRVVRQQRMGFMATVCPEGSPNLSPKGTATVWDEDRLVFADLGSPVTIDNLGHNPACEINVIDTFLRKGYRFKGTAELMPSGSPGYDFVAEPFWAENGTVFPGHEIVKVAVTRAAPGLSPAYTFIDGITEEDLREAYLAKYGVQPVE